ncbi:MAG: putative transcriptional regulator [Acidimicrobiales bacterium]|nr:putative transcriptional regulator [Acidimicrobiales bacterium]
MSGMGTRRTYRQLCGLAAALDVVGERWTMLLVRDLALGPRRYGELLDGLPGIGEGLLAQRLRHLEAEDLVRRTFSSEVGAVVYELTDSGRDLWEAMVPLAAWGLERVEPIEQEDVRADWLALQLQARFDPTKSVGIRERYEMRVDDEPYAITADDGRITVERGEVPDAVVRISLDLDTVMKIGIGQLTIAGAREAGLTKLEGDPEAVARYGTLLRSLN